MNNFVEILTQRAADQANDVGYVFLGDRSSSPEEWTYGELDRRARWIAYRLRQRCQPGDRALLLFPSCLNYIAALFGCFYAGVVAVPAYPPGPRHRHRLSSIAADCEPAVVLTTQGVAATVSSWGDSSWDSARLMTVDGGAESGVEWPEAAPSDSDLAFLQYTSGSTGSPKGVMVTHGNLIENQRMIESAFGHDRETVVVSWLPMFHDMGLVGGVLQPLYLGAKCVLMSPGSFLQHPIRWLKAISDYRATSSGGPNFAYEYCVKRIRAEQMADIDLRGWRVAFNGSEVVRAETLRGFSEKFRSRGFRENAFYPCYGMAEATLLVTGVEPDRANAT